MSQWWPDDSKVAFSFRRTHRDQISQIAHAVEDKLGKGSVVYEEWSGYRPRLQFPYQRHRGIYRFLSTLLVACISEFDVSEHWTRREYRRLYSMLRRITREDVDLRILPLWVGEGDVPDINRTAVFPYLRRQSVNANVQMILDRLAQIELTTSNAVPGGRTVSEFVYRIEHAQPRGEISLAGGLTVREFEPPIERAKTGREITVTGHDFHGAAVSRFQPGTMYRLRLRVAPPLAENLASGPTAIENVLAGCIQTHWVVTSTDVEFVAAMSTAKVQKVGRTWLAEFDLVLPEHGESESEDVAVVVGAEPRNLLLTVYAVSASGGREIYREVSVSLSDRPGVKADETCKAPLQTHLKSTHEWTTPPEHIQISITKGLAVVSTVKPRLELYEFIEPFVATANLISGVIENVRASLESFRELQEAYLNDLDPGDIAARLAHNSWQTYYANQNGWQPLPDCTDPAHSTAFDKVRQSKEWQALASDGYALFDECFPKESKLRGLLEKLQPGSRIDFHWTEQSGGEFVSHVPWALMYMDSVDVTGQMPADPEKFLGLRFRIGSRSWSVGNGALALGDLNTTNALHLLYWGNKPGDEVAAEAQWQANEYKHWQQSRLLPDPASPNPKSQILGSLQAPAPSPVGIVYFYCHCSVGDGAQPCLRFGNTSKPEDTVVRTELSSENIPDGPIIFANACSTARADPHITSELERRFFKRGVRAFIGTETKVPIRLASKFAWLYLQFFYRRVDKQPMAAGEALTQARLFLWTQYKNVGGLFYCMTNQYDLYLASNQELLQLRH